MADNLSPLVNLDLINKIYKTINAQITERVYDPQYNPGVALGADTSRYSNAYLQALNVQGDAAISGNTSTGTLNSLTLTKKSAGFTISGGTTAKTLTVADTATITKSLEVAAATSIKSNLTVSAATNIVKSLTVGATDTGTVTIKSGGTGNTTIVGPGGGTANLVNGTYTSIVRENFNTANTASTLVKRDQNGDISVSKVNGVALGNSTASFTVTGGSATPKTLTVNSAATLGSSTTSENGSVTVKSAGTSSTTITGPNGKEAKLIDGTYTPSATTENSTTPEENKLLKIKKVDANMFFAGPATGTDQKVPEYRSIVASDLPEELTDSNAATANQVKTKTISTDAKHYISFVDSNNTDATAETVYTNSKLTYNPFTGTLSATSFNGTADKTAYSLSITDGASTSAINSWNGSTDKTLTIKGESPVTTTATDGTITITHATSGVTAGTYKSVTVDAKGHVTAGTTPTTLCDYGITDAKIADGTITLGLNSIIPLTEESTLAASKVSGTLTTNNIPSLDASKITTGTIAVERLPATALERCVVVASDTARFALTTASVQVGDTVKVTDTKKMYMVVDSSNLSTDAGYEEYFTSTDWSTVTNKPSSYTPSSHPHGNITNAGAIGTDANKLIATTTNGVLTAATTLAATSLAAGSTPTVSLSNGTLTFGIPKGDKGATGATGATGPKGDTGATGATPTIKAASGANIGSVGTPSVSADTSGTTTTFTFNYLKGAKGDKGDTGSQGPVGPNFDLEAGSGVQYLIGASSQNGNISTARTSSAYYNGSNLYASGFYVSSLRSLKENIEPTKVNATDLINSQEIVDFNYKADEDKTHKVGLIADDSDPLFLDKRGETVDLYNTCGILMKAVQELSKKIEELEQKLS